MHHAFIDSLVAYNCSQYLCFVRIAAVVDLGCLSVYNILVAWFYGDIKGDLLVFSSKTPGCLSSETFSQQFSKIFNI